MTAISLVGATAAAFLLGASNAFADGETITGSSSFAGLVNTAIPIDDVQITAAGNPTLPVRLNVTNGSLAMGSTEGLGFTGASSGSTVEFTGSLDDINAALATLTYTRTNTGSDNLEVSLVDAGQVFFPGNGHLYEYVSSTQTWTGAQSAAAAREKYGATGYLTTITSQAENDFVADRLANAGWMGAQDIVENDWKWTTGPEANTSFWSGGIGGSVVPGQYANWNTSEPNNSGSNEDCAQFLAGASGKWNDLPCTVTTLPGYVVEYGAVGDLPGVASYEAPIYTVRKPVFASPASDSSSNMINVDFTLYSAPQPGTLKLGFYGANYRSITLDDLTPGHYTFTLDPQDLLANTNVASAYPNGEMPDDIYTEVRLEYTDATSGYGFSERINNFTIDTQAPGVGSLTPADNATGVSVDSNLVIDFDEAIVAGSGNIVIRNAQDDTIFETIPISSGMIDGDGNGILTINPSNDFAAGAAYYVEIDEGAVADAIGNDYVGISGKTPWNFTTFLDTDSDDDGIPDATENEGINNGDANDDTIADSEQPYVTSFVSEVTGKPVILEVSDDCTIADSAMTDVDTSSTDDSFTYPAGMMDFVVDCGTPGFVADIAQYYYDLSGEYVARKLNTLTGKYGTIEGAQITGMTIGGSPVKKVAYQVADGGSLDMDASENGQIEDPAGLGLPNQSDSLAETGQNQITLMVIGVGALTVSMSYLIILKVISGRRNARS